MQPETLDADPRAIQRTAPDAFGPLPLEAYMPSVMERHRIDHAVKLLTDRCMADLGFGPGSELSSIEDLVVDEREARNRRYGIIDVEQVKATGLLPAFRVADRHRDDLPFDDSRNFPELGWRDGESPSWEEETDSPGEVNGKPIPPNGCLGQARRQIYGTNAPVTHFVLADDLENGTHDDAIADPRVLAVEQQWVSCMTGRGQNAVGVWDESEPDKVKEGLPEDERPTAREIQFAVADAECNNEVGYAATAYEVEVGLQQTVVDEHRLVLTTERLRINDALLKAEIVLAGG
ncbi:MAG: hypothetical protein Q4D96_08515 [Propionibacteriaceae bacterium]|nr:hypothetical protein [Propionibacteriaceae bacterium]